MILILHVPGAAPEALERGVAAAQEVLNAARVSAAEAALRHWARAEWQRSGSQTAKPPDGIIEAAAAFALAETAAMDACCAGTPAPAGSWLEATDA